MNWKNIFKKAVDVAVPFIFLLTITLISSYLYLIDGIASGDDSTFHLGNIYDTYYGLMHGLSIDSTNHNMMGIYSYNTHLFYAPMPHYFAAILMIIFNCSNIVALKLAVSIFCFIAALFFYLFAKKISHSETISLLAAAFFIFCPYRMFCGYCRFAYAETVAISILPVLFYGIYSFTHDEKPTYRAFIAIILGVSGLILSHPVTALFAVIIALAYMALRYKNTWKMISCKKGLILSGVTVVMIFALVGFYFFPMLAAKSSGLYRISDEMATWTNYGHVASSTSTSADFSGFLNIDWINGQIEAGRWPKYEAPYIYLVEVAFLVGSFVILLVSDILTKKFLKNKILGVVISVLASLILPIFSLIFLIRDFPLYFGIVIVDIIYVINKLCDKEVETISNNDKEKVSINRDVLKDVIFLGSITVLTLVFIFVGQAWHLLPKLFYATQFAWRLWSIITITVSWLFVILLNWAFKSKNRLKFISPLLIVPSLLLVLSMSYREKGIALLYPDSQANIVKSYDEKDAQAVSYIGAMNEYSPLIFYDNNYVSEYENSLYTTIKYSIGNRYTYVFTKENYIDPAFLIGEGSMTCTDLNIPNATFDAAILSDEALIQLPQFYYDGYEITLVNKETAEKTTAEVTQVDSLVSFNATKGEYVVTVEYKGPMIRRVFNVFFYIGLAGLAGLSVFAVREFILEKKKAPFDKGEDK